MVNAPRDGNCAPDIDQEIRIDQSDLRELVAGCQLRHVLDYTSGIVRIEPAAIEDHVSAVTTGVRAADTVAYGSLRSPWRW